LKIQSKGKIDPYPELKNNMLRAMAMGVHLNIFRQFLGLNTLVSYAGIIVSKDSPAIGPYTNFFVNGIELIATLIATFWVADRFGRRFLLMYSVTLFTICNFLIVLGLLINQGIFTLVFMIILMGTFGIAYSVVSWAYPA
jgi:MFS family permease